jgi:hypothetical protein
MLFFFVGVRRCVGFIAELSWLTGFNAHPRLAMSGPAMPMGTSGNHCWKAINIVLDIWIIWPGCLAILVISVGIKSSCLLYPIYIVSTLLIYFLFPYQREVLISKSADTRSYGVRREDITFTTLSFSKWVTLFTFRNITLTSAASHSHSVRRSCSLWSSRKPEGARALKRQTW